MKSSVERRLVGSLYLLFDKLCLWKSEKHEVRAEQITWERSLVRFINILNGVSFQLAASLIEIATDTDPIVDVENKSSLNSENQLKLHFV